MSTHTKDSNRSARARRTHARARSSSNPRLVVYRSNKTVYAQIIDDIAGKVLCGASGLKSKLTGVKAAEEVGTQVAQLAQKQKVSAVTFDRNGYKYHGQIKALADAARAAGLKF
ncbi:50S ribosomal protein L18 [Candidatus Gracilibacteria bacterium]|nr:50S ribosomal protein L18 [Candidatus Gracilibacteria bacterium]